MTRSTPVFDLVNEKIYRSNSENPLEIPANAVVVQGSRAISGGFGKENAVDRVVDIARSHSIPNVLVEFGHDVRVIGAPPGAPCWAVGVEDSRMPGAVRARLAVTDAGIATSGDYIRYFESGGRRYGHIIDPRTGQPSETVSGVSVIAQSAAVADALATAFNVIE